MGQFSWIYSDTEKQMVNGLCKKSYLLVPDEFRSDIDKMVGNGIEEKCYDGYGHFGKYDVFNLVARWNREALKGKTSDVRGDYPSYAVEYFNGASLEEIYEKHKSEFLALTPSSSLELERRIGIAIACYDEQNANLPFPIKIVENCNLNYENVGPSDSDPNQGWFSPRLIESMREYYFHLRDEFNKRIENGAKAAAFDLMYENAHRLDLIECVNSFIEDEDCANYPAIRKLFDSSDSLQSKEVNCESLIQFAMSTNYNWLFSVTDVYKSPAFISSSLE